MQEVSVLNQRFDCIIYMLSLGHFNIVNFIVQVV